MSQKRKSSMLSTLGSEPKVFDQTHYWFERMGKEDDLIHYRMMWLLSSQTIFIGAYGLLLTPRPPEKTSYQFVLISDLIQYIALFSGFLIYLSIIAAVLAMRSYRVNHPKIEITGPAFTHFLGSQSYVLLPLIFIGTWLFILIGNLPVVIAIMIIWLLIFVLCYFFVKLQLPKRKSAS